MTDPRPFAGITVIEFGQFIAVPYCAQLLADGGARVIKIEPHGGDPVRALAPLAPGESRHFISRNRGKRCLQLDLRHPRAASIIRALFQQADVALFNLRPGLGAELGLDYGALSPLYPRLITGNVTAFGKDGPDANLAGMDLVVQARSGLMTAMGRLIDGLPAAGDTPVIDFMCAMTLAFGISTALYRRELTGHGSEVDVSLLGAGIALQTTMLTRVDAVDRPVHEAAEGQLNAVRADGRGFVEQMAISPSARASHMTGIYYRTLATRDSAIAIACSSPANQRRFMAAIGMTDDALDRKMPRAEQPAHYAVLQTAVEARLRERTTAEWKAAFDAAGLPASPVLLTFELFEDDQPLLNGMLRDLRHPALGDVRLPAPPLSIGPGSFEPGPFAAPFGSEARSILAEFGLTESEIESAIAENAVLSFPAE